MRLLADESVDRPIVERLLRTRCEVDYVAEFDPGIIDDVVIERARAQASLLVTADKDFGEPCFVCSASRPAWSSYDWRVSPLI